MQNKSKYFVLIVLLSAFLIGGCSKDNNNPASPANNEDVPPAPQIKTVTVPQAMQQSQDAHAIMTSSYISMANTVQIYTAFFSPPSGKIGNISSTSGDYVKSWNYGGANVTLTASQTSDGYNWNITLNGVFDNVTYNDFKFIEATSSTDGSSGQLMLFSPDNSEYTAEWIWSTLASGVYNITMRSNQTAQDQMRIVVSSNPDNSGSVEVYNIVNSNPVKNYQSSWSASGSGQWSTFDDQGNLQDSGSW